VRFGTCGTSSRSGLPLAQRAVRPCSRDGPALALVPPLDSRLPRSLLMSVPPTRSTPATSAPLRSILKVHVARVCFKCFRYYVSTEVSRADPNLYFYIFLFLTCLIGSHGESNPGLLDATQVLYCKSRSRYYICCNGCAHMLQAFIPNVSSVLFTYVASVFVWMLYMF